MGQAVGIGDSLGEAMVDLDLSRVIEGTMCEILLGDMEGKIAEGSIELIIMGAMVMSHLVYYCLYVTWV